MTDPELQAIRERCEKATPGPWAWLDENAGDFWRKELYSVRRNDSTIRLNRVLYVELTGSAAAIEEVEAHIAADGDDEEGGEADLDFVASARSDIPALLTEIDRLRTENERLEERIRWHEEKEATP